MAFEEIVGELPVLRAGKLDALVVAKHGGDSCRSHDVKPGDTLLIVVVRDWPKFGLNSTKVRIMVANPSPGDEGMKEARYHAPRIRDLTRKNRLSNNPAWPDEALATL